LRVHPDNPRYFTDGSGRAVYLTGSHTWSNIVDMSPADPPAAFDFDAFLDWTAGYGHNFIRLWTWELTNWDTRGNNPKHSKNKLCSVAPHPWARSGPGTALDGKPKFNLKQFNPEYFERLRARVEAAGRRGFYVSVMLFEGWGLQRSPGAWENHPFHPANNVNGIDGDANGDGTVNIVDALQIARFDAGLNPEPFYSGSADADCNGSINIIDALQIARFDAGLIFEFCA